MTHKITTTWKGGLLFDSDNPSNHHVLMDTIVEGKERQGLSPKAMMLSSLAGCSGLDVVSILEKMKIEVDDFKMEVEGELTEEHPKYYKTVWVTYHFTGTDLNEEKINRAVQLSVEKYCGVMEMFRQFADVKIDIKFHNK